MTVYIVRYANYFGENGIAGVYLNEEKAKQCAAMVNNENGLYAWIDDREVIE